MPHLVPLSITDHILEIFNSFLDKFYQTFCLCWTFSVICNSSLELNHFKTVSSRIISLNYTFCILHLIKNLVCCRRNVWTFLPLSQNIWGKLCRWSVVEKENLAQQQKSCSFPAPEKPSSPSSNFQVITQYKLHL